MNIPLEHSLPGRLIYAGLARRAGHAAGWQAVISSKGIQPGLRIGAKNVVNRTLIVVLAGRLIAHVAQHVLDFAGLPPVPALPGPTSSHPRASPRVQHGPQQVQPHVRLVGYVTENAYGPAFGQGLVVGVRADPVSMAGNQHLSFRVAVDVVHDLTDDRLGLRPDEGVVEIEMDSIQYPGTDNVFH